MTEQTAKSSAERQILIVEDEYLVAIEISDVLVERGAVVLGPVGRLEQAMELAKSAALIGAILDVNLQGTMVFPVAQILAERGVPFVFMTGYDDSILPSEFATITRYQKPTDTGVLEEIAFRFLGDGRSAGE